MANNVSHRVPLAQGTCSAPHHSNFPPLEQVNRPTVTTEQAAHYLNRRPQTLRIWAMGSGPIQPLRINGRLAWPVVELKRVLGLAIQ